MHCVTMSNRFSCCAWVLGPNNSEAEPRKGWGGGRLPPALAIVPPTDSDCPTLEFAADYKQHLNFFALFYFLGIISKCSRTCKKCFSVSEQLQSCKLKVCFYDYCVDFSTFGCMD